MRSGVEVEFLGRVLVAARVCALPLSLRTYLLHEIRGGLDSDELEDPFQALQPRPGQDEHVHDAP